MQPTKPVQLRAKKPKLKYFAFSLGDRNGRVEPPPHMPFWQAALSSNDKDKHTLPV
jgi:hypothetical protein